MSEQSEYTSLLPLLNSLTFDNWRYALVNKNPMEENAISMVSIEECQYSVDVKARILVLQTEVLQVEWLEMSM